MKFTFKKHPKETGLSSIGHPNPWVDVKIGKKKMGQIIPANYHRQHFGVMFAVRKPEGRTDNCDWQWIEVGKKFETEQDARDYIKSDGERLLSGYAIHYFDDEDD